jgi:hypothetical protein
MLINIMVNYIFGITIKCQRCRKTKTPESFWKGVNRLKLCYECREYNQKYLSKLRKTMATN